MDMKIVYMTARFDGPRPTRAVARHSVNGGIQERQKCAAAATYVIGHCFEPPLHDKGSPLS